MASRRALKDVRKELIKKKKVLVKRQREIIRERMGLEKEMIRLKGLMEEEAKYVGKITDGGHRH